MPRTLIAGNWKMNGLREDALRLLNDLRERSHAGGPELACDLLVCPPFTLLAEAASILSDTTIAVGGQDCHEAASGAHTGDIAAAMLADVGCSFVIVGHSERRQDHGEDDALVRAKAEAALSAGLTPIVCVGETDPERQEGRALEVISRQIEGSLPRAGQGAGIVIAYEPVWAIGTGKTASPADVSEVHAAIRALLGEIMGGAGDEVRILYGGSVKPGNAFELLDVDNVDGALVGGASLKAEDFWAIAQAAG